ncbi:PAS domain-containing protein [Henriciella sp.]|uniref:PAS domain-containing protein n=1 Tax=Henriciella sp. TaxID=1968823 RepID=UPI00261F8F54|nr:PAS domain-containing protein [Henriciella sp.]
MNAKAGFRGLNAAQREIVAHWHSVRGTRLLPGKSDIDPGALRAHLASISIVEVDDRGEARFRIAGSGLRRILGGEMRGRALRELDREKAEMWSLGLSAAIDRAVPVGGIIDRAKDRHAWLRLPLGGGAGAASLVLCHDVLVAHESTDDPKPFGIFSGRPHGLAA